MTAVPPDCAFRGANRVAARAKVQAAQTDAAVVLVPALPEIVARTGIASPLLPIRMANALQRAGARTIGEISGWTFADFLLDGVGATSISETIYALDALVSLPPARLARLSQKTIAGLPNLPVEAIVALTAARSVDDEILALLADRPERNRALILARWGYGADGARTLDEVGAAFRITRERARQIVSGKEKEIAASGVRLLLASEAVNDLDEAGGVLPDPDYQLLLRYGQVNISPSALRVLPELSGLGVVPEVRFDAPTRLWATGRGHARLDDQGGMRQLAALARRRTARHLRRTGSVPVALLDDLSPFGREHSISLLEVNGDSFEIVGEHALRIPLRDSRFLRQCRKTLIATGELELDSLLHGLRSSGLNVTRTLLVEVLMRSEEFLCDEGRVRLSSSTPRGGILSPAEACGFALLEQNGGAMSWWDFIEAMKAAGFSAPMAALVLRKPAVKRLGPSTYGLRGRIYDAATLARLRARRQQMVGRRVIPTTAVKADGEIHATYTLNRFALQGVLPVPRELRSLPGTWTARLPDGRSSTVKVSKGFMWPFQSILKSFRLKPGDKLDLVFTSADRSLRIRVAGGAVSADRPKPVSREQQLLRALFGQDI